MLQAAGSSDPQKPACWCVGAPSTRPVWHGIIITGTSWKCWRRYVRKSRTASWRAARVSPSA
jgi:hypothetical protein